MSHSSWRDRGISAAEFLRLFGEDQSLPIFQRVKAWDIESHLARGLDPLGPLPDLEGLARELQLVYCQGGMLKAAADPRSVDSFLRNVEKTYGPATMIATLRIYQTLYGSSGSWEVH
jgi:hypothetical protein